jgi:hypothetical protein
MSETPWRCRRRPGDVGDAPGDVGDAPIDVGDAPSVVGDAPGVLETTLVISADVGRCGYALADVGCAL